MNLERRIQELERNQVAADPWNLSPIVIYSHDGVVTETLLVGQPYTGSHEGRRVHHVAFVTPPGYGPDPY